MNKIIIVVVLIFSMNTFSQSTFKFKSGGRVTYNDVKMSSDSIRNLMSSSPNALELYNIGRTKKTVGNVLLFGGIGGVLIALNNQRRAYSTADGGASYTPLIVGGVMLITAIPVKIGFSNKIRQAIILANQDLRNPKTSYIESTDLVINSNGIGFQITF